MPRFPVVGSVRLPQSSTAPRRALFAAGFAVGAALFRLAAPLAAADPVSCIVDGYFFDDCSDSGIIFGEGPGGDGGTATQLPDLTSLGGFNFLPLSIRAGEPYDASVVLVNLGGLQFADNLILVELYLVPQGGDLFLSENRLGSVELYFPRVTSDFPDPTYVGVPVSGVLPGSIAPGQYRLAVKIDVDNAIVESNELNNGVAAGPTIAVEGEPDLAPRPSSLLPIGTIAQGSSLTLRARVDNLGRDELRGPASIGLRFRAVAPGGDELGGVTLGTTTLTIAAGATFAAGTHRLSPTLLATANLPPGSYDVALDVDTAGAVAEADELNNAGFVGSFVVAAATPGAKPDLAPHSPSMKAPTPLEVGNRVLFRFALKNQGSAVGPVTTVRYNVYLSLDTSFGPGDFEPPIRLTSGGSFGFGDEVAIPGPGASTTHSFSFTWPSALPEGPWNVGIVVNEDGSVAESNGLNNSLLLGQVVATKPCRRYASHDDARTLFDRYFLSKSPDLFDTPGPRGEYCVATGSFEDDLLFFGVGTANPPADLCGFGSIYQALDHSLLLFVMPAMHERCVVSIDEIPEDAFALGPYELLVGYLEDFSRQLKKQLALAKKACDNAAALNPASAKKRRYCACTDPDYLNWATTGPRPGSCAYNP